MYSGKLQGTVIYSLLFVGKNKHPETLLYVIRDEMFYNTS